MRMNSRLLYSMVVLLALVAGDVFAQESNFKLGETLGLRYFTLTEGDEAAYEQRVVDINYSFYERHMPGVDWVLMKGDRGARDGRYAWFYNIDSVDRRNFYWPTEEGPWPATDSVSEAWTSEIGEAPFRDFAFEAENVGDYVLVGAENVREMPWIGVLGIHHLRLKPGQEEAFERFVAEKWNPKSHLPGTWGLVYKADRGERKGGYALIWAFEPGLVRDAYLPQPGEQTVEGQHAFRVIEELWGEMQTFLDNPPETEYTDFVLIR